VSAGRDHCRLPLGSSGDWHAQAPIVSDPGVLPDFSALVAAYSSAVVNIAATQTVRASDPATGGDVIVRTEGSGFVVSPGGVILTSAISVHFVPAGCRLGFRAPGSSFRWKYRPDSQLIPNLSLWSQPMTIRGP